MTTIMYRWLYRVCGKSAYDGSHRRSEPVDEYSGSYPLASRMALR
jgi:hypothetical protein